MSAFFPNADGPTEQERFFFDLKGFIIVRGVLTPDQLAATWESLDQLQRLRKGQWSGWAHGHLLHRAWEAFEKTSPGKKAEVDPRVAQALQVLCGEGNDFAIAELARPLEITPGHLQSLFQK